MLYGQWVGTRECLIFLFRKRCDNGACSMGELNRERGTSLELHSSLRLKEKKENRTIIRALMHLFTACFSSLVTIMQFFKIPLLILLNIVYHEHFSCPLQTPVKISRFCFA